MVEWVDVVNLAICFIGGIGWGWALAEYAARKRQPNSYHIEKASLHFMDGSTTTLATPQPQGEAK